MKVNFLDLVWQIYILRRNCGGLAASEEMGNLERVDTDRCIFGFVFFDEIWWQWTKQNKLTKAAENVVEIVEIIIAFLQYSSVAIGDVDLSVGVSHCAGAGKNQKKNQNRLKIS